MQTTRRVLRSLGHVHLALKLVAEPLMLRDEAVVPGLVVVRLGAVTLSGQHLRRSVEECHARWGIWGFSVLEVPDGDFSRGWRGCDRSRQSVDRCSSPMALSSLPTGSRLLPTLDSPHWTVALSAPTPAFFERVRGHFRGPIANPAYRQ